ncbi:MAG: ATP-dependent Clp protease adaptor ClpS [Acidobacteria bacterium]|nr:ATP-dependent Clp protease adaptor ClpS [Acidobacteriota bacterium]
MAKQDFQADELTVSKSKEKLKKPPLYKVLLHNDDYTTMDFVLYILFTIFHKSESEAFTIMLKVHHEGVGVAGVYPYEVAETKAEKAIALARQNEFPLLCTVEEE